MSNPIGDIRDVCTNVKMMYFGAVHMAKNRGREDVRSYAVGRAFVTEHGKALVSTMVSLLSTAAYVHRSFGTISDAARLD